MMVSIVMPAHNAAEYIAIAIDSVKAQSYTDWELLVVDDASRDSTSAIAESYNDHRIRCFRSETNLGSARARNRALEKAEGRFIAFLDADDEWLPLKLEKQLRFMTDTGFGISCTDYVKVDPNGNKVSETITGPAIIDYDTLLGSNSIACSSAIVDRSRYPDLEMPNIRLNHDYALWLSLLRDGDIAGRFKEILMHYRVHGTSLSRNKLESARTNWKIYREFERLSAIKSMFCMVKFVTRGLRKYLK